MSFDYEQKSAARDAGITPRAWRRLSAPDQAEVMALRRIDAKTAAVERQERRGKK